MGIKRDASGVILDTLESRGSSIKWLHRATGIPYKTLLRELKQRPETLSLFHVLLILDALGYDKPAKRSFMEEVAK